MSLSHHGDFEQSELMRRFYQRASGKQPERKYPQGRLSGDDDGQVEFMVGEKDGTIVLDFGKPVTWVGMSPQDAINLAQMLIKHARGVATQPLQIQLH